MERFFVRFILAAAVGLIFALVLLVGMAVAMIVYL